MDEDEEQFGGLYEGGQWIWNEKQNCLEYTNIEAKIQEDQTILAAMTSRAQGGAMQFRDDIDVIEQIRFRRRYQRKVRPGDPDVVTVQDIKDLALYTAPLNILSPELIDLLHQISTERFIRALILYCQYYLQTMELMNCRKEEGLSKIRTPESDVIEAMYSENLSDLRLLVAKEYSTFLIGGAEISRFHHMGEAKKAKSLTKKDAELTETLLQICTQIVWLALGRKSYNQLELEIHRLFKSGVFNVVDHKLKTGYVENMTPQEKMVFLGNCLRHDKKLCTRSPVSNEIFCSSKAIDFTMLGIGAISYLKLTDRISYFANAISAPEDMLPMCGVTVGILGMNRSRFDILLRPLPDLPDVSESRSQSINLRLSQTMSSKRVSSTKKSTIFVGPDKIYPDIVLPKPGISQRLPSAFPHITYCTPPCSFVQRNIWQQRLRKLQKAMKNKSTVSLAPLN